MKEIDVEKVRSAILSLQANGKHEFASIVWDLLDNYVSQKPHPVVMRQDGVRVAHDHVKAAKEIVRSLRGASAWEGFPRCDVTDYMGGDKPCTTPAVGHLVRLKDGKSYNMCDTHGTNLESKGYTDWVQTFFGDENSAAGERSE